MEEIVKRELLELPVDYVHPSSPKEKRIVDLWSELLKIKPVGMEDDFFDLGGDSLAAENLSLSFSENFGVDLKPGQLARWNTPRKLAGLLKDDAPEENLPSNILAVNPEGGREAAFFIHGRAGISFLKPPFLAGMHSDQPIYSFQAQGYDGQAEPLDRVEDIAAAYMKSMLDIRPRGPWHMISFCAGGWIGVEIARRMKEEGLEPSSVTLVDINTVPFRMRNEWKWRNRAIVRSNIPVLSNAAMRIGIAASTVARRYRIFMKTGVIGDFSVEGIQSASGVVDHFVRKTGKKYDRKIRSLSDEQGLDDHGRQERERLLEIYSTSAVRRTTALLELAFQTHMPTPLESPLNVILSEKRASRLQRPDHPLRVLLPNMNLIVCGETHRDVVGSTETARIVQRLIDEASAGAGRTVQSYGPVRQNSL